MSVPSTPSIMQINASNHFGRLMGFRPTRRIRTWVFVLCVMVAKLPLVAGPVRYTSSYEASVLPEESTPHWFVSASAGAMADIDESTLKASTLTGASCTQYWAIGNSKDEVLGDSAAWMTVTATIDFRVRVTESISPEEPEGAQGFWIHVADASFRYWNFYIGKSAIYSTNVVSGEQRVVDAASVNINPTTFNTYRISIDEGFANLYVNDSADPIFVDLPGLPGIRTLARVALMFGDISSIQSSSYTLEYIKWSNIEAEFSPPISTRN